MSFFGLNSDDSYEEDVARSIGDSRDFREATIQLEKAAERIDLMTMPLKKSVAECIVQCFKGVRDPWSMGAGAETRRVNDCIGQCEQPMSRLAEVVDQQRTQILDNTSQCLQRCTNGAEDNEGLLKQCLSTCVQSTLSEGAIRALTDSVQQHINALR